MTHAGLELEAVLTALGRWGIRFMAEPTGDEFRSHWLAFPVPVFHRDADPGCPAPASSSARRSRPGHRSRRRASPHPDRPGPPPPTPDLILDGPPRAILGLLTGALTPAQAQDRGLAITGDPAVLRRIQPQPADPAVKSLMPNEPG